MQKRWLLIIFPLLAAAGAIDVRADMLLVDEQLRLYHTADGACGIASLYHALAGIGVNVAVDGIAAEVPVSLAGSSMYDMTDYLDKQDVPWAAVETDRLGPLLAITSAERRSLILLVDDATHFVAVVRAVNGAVLVLDGEVATGVTDLERRYSGKAVLVGNGSRAIALWHFTGVPALILALVMMAGIGCGALIMYRVFMFRWSNNHHGARIAPIQKGA